MRESFERDSFERVVQGGLVRYAKLLKFSLDANSLRNEIRFGLRMSGLVEPLALL